jgi:hypothetical protein
VGIFCGYPLGLGPIAIPIEEYQMVNKWLTWIGDNLPYNVEFCSTLMDKAETYWPTIPFDILLLPENATM